MVHYWLRPLKTAYVLAPGKALGRETDADVRETYRRLIERQRKELEATKK